MIKIQQLFLRPPARLKLTLLETEVGANDCKCNWNQRLNVPSEGRTFEKHHHQPINVSSAGTQAFFLNYKKENGL
jgi:hypothetical protein